PHSRDRRTAWGQADRPVVHARTRRPPRLVGRPAALLRGGPPADRAAHRGGAWPAGHRGLARTVAAGAAATLAGQPHRRPDLDQGAPGAVGAPTAPRRIDGRRPGTQAPHAVPLLRP